MELAVVVLLFAFFLIGFKLLGLLLKATFFVLSIPFQIFGAIFGVVIALIILPFAAVAGFMTLLFAPFFILGSFLPFLLVGFGLYLITRN